MLNCEVKKDVKSVCFEANTENQSFVAMVSGERVLGSNMCEVNIALNDPDNKIAVICHTEILKINFTEDELMLYALKKLDAMGDKFVDTYNNIVYPPKTTVEHDSETNELFQTDYITTRIPFKVIDLEALEELQYLNVEEFDSAFLDWKLDEITLRCAKKHATPKGYTPEF